MTGQASSLPRTARHSPAFEAPIPFDRVVMLELRKCFDTRAGLWLVVGMVITSLMASVGVIVAIPAEDLTYSAMATAAGVPPSLLLPILAALLVTSEWSQRTALSTFTLVPGRSRVIAAKGVAAVVVGVSSVLAAMAVAGLGTFVGGAVRGVDPSWLDGIHDVGYPVLGQVLGLLAGFALGVLVRSSAGAVVAVILTSVLVPGATDALAQARPGFADLQPWVDFVHSKGLLYGGSLSGVDWAALAVSGVLWLVVPTAVGLWSINRDELS